MIEIRNNERVVRYNDSDEVKDKVFQRVIQFCIEHDSFIGESIAQSDNPSIDAAPTLCEIVDDIIQFDVEWK